MKRKIEEKTTKDKSTATNNHGLATIMSDNTVVHTEQCAICPQQLFINSIMCTLLFFSPSFCLFLSLLSVYISFFPISFSSRVVLRLASVPSFTFIRNGIFCFLLKEASTTSATFMRNKSWILCCGFNMHNCSWSVVEIYVFVYLERFNTTIVTFVFIYSDRVKKQFKQCYTLICWPCIYLTLCVSARDTREITVDLDIEIWAKLLFFFCVHNYKIIH